MKSCTFFCHRNILDPIDELLQKTIIDLIENKNVRHFYVGNQGQFDAVVFETLKQIKILYPDICYNVVLAYIPKQPLYYDNTDILPEGIENIPPRFAISWRNKWILNKSDYVITYIKYSWGSAAKFKELAEKHNKIVINLV